jgi:hypothetical protein
LYAALLRRQLVGQSICAADRGHLPQRLKAEFGNNYKVLACVAICSAVTCGFALVSGWLKSDAIALYASVAVVATLAVTGWFGKEEFELFASRSWQACRSIADQAVADPVDNSQEDRLLAERCRSGEVAAQLLATMPGVSVFIAVAIVCRILPIGRFPSGRSLANFLGLTPGSNNTGDRERLGSITKVGSRMVRVLLAQVILHVLRRDATVRAWYLRIKRRRGSKIARVAVMRRTAVIMWRMLSTGERWRPGAANAETPAAANGPRQARLYRPRRTMLLALSSSEAGSSTGSSSLSRRKEAARCPA